MRTIHALRAGNLQGTHRYTVGTFPKERGGFRAYLLTYNASWEGCVEYEVIAHNGAEAKKAAIAQRKLDEQGKH